MASEHLITPPSPQAAAVIQRYHERHFEITGFYPTINDMATMFEKPFEYIAAALEAKLDTEGTANE